MAARNMYRIEMNIHEKELCVRLVIYKDSCIEFHKNSTQPLITNVGPRKDGQRVVCPHKVFFVPFPTS